MTGKELRGQAERELANDLRVRVVCVSAKNSRYQREYLNVSGEVTVVRPVDRTAYTIWCEAVRGRVALLERYRAQMGVETTG